MEPMFRRNAEVAAVEMLPGVQRKTMTTSPSMMLCEVTLAGGSVVPMHQHPHEQIGYVVSGRIAMNIGGNERIFAAGDSYAIPGDTPHDGRAQAEGCVVIDIFTPHREDYK